MSWALYIKYQALCFLRSHNLLSMFLSSAQQTITIFLLWKYPSVHLHNEAFGVYLSTVVAMVAMLMMGDNLFGWHYGSGFLLYVSPRSIMQRLPALLSLLYGVFMVAIIDLGIFYSVGRIAYTPEKQALFYICLFTITAVAVYESLMTSIHQPFPIKKNAFSFGEAMPKRSRMPGTRFLSILVPTLIPVGLFYTIGEHRWLWFSFVIVYAIIISGLLYWQLQSIPQKAYAARFHLHQSLKGLK